MLERRGCALAGGPSARSFNPATGLAAPQKHEGPTPFGTSPSGAAVPAGIQRLTSAAPLRRLRLRPGGRHRDVLVNAQIVQVVTAANYLKDVNASGTLTVADKGIADTQITKALPAP